MSLTQQLKNRVRYFNKHVTNRVLGQFAGTTRGPFALVRHVGRRSGKAYETPILVVPAAGSFVIALTYGPEVDWYRNARAAGGCRIVWHGREYAITDLELVEAESARRLFRQPAPLILRLMGIRDYVRLFYQTAGTNHA